VPDAAADEPQDDERRTTAKQGKRTREHVRCAASTQTAGTIRVIVDLG